MERGARDDPDYDIDIDILGWPGSRRGRVCDPQHDARAAKEHDIAEHGLQRLRGPLEKLETHARAAELMSPGAAGNVVAPSRM
jgi:hypothetical protein